jgi:hypothetical protein
LLLTNGISISFVCNFSHMKWQSTSIYLVHSWNIEFEAIWRVARLSQNIFINEWMVIFKLVSNYFIQINSLVVDVIAQCSATALTLLWYFIFCSFIWLYFHLHVRWYRGMHILKFYQLPLCYDILKFYQSPPCEMI